MKHSALVYSSLNHLTPLEIQQKSAANVMFILKIKRKTHTLHKVCEQIRIILILSDVVYAVTIALYGFKTVILLTE